MKGVSSHYFTHLILAAGEGKTEVASVRNYKRVERERSRERKCRASRVSMVPAELKSGWKGKVEGRGKEDGS